MSRSDVLERQFDNVGPGPERVSLADIASAGSFLIVLLQRDHFCTNCREQVKAIADRYDEFRERDVTVVSILPEPADRARSWQERYDLPFPLLADPDAALGGRYDQPVRFGKLGRWSDFFGRMPATVILDTREGPPEPAWTHRGRSTFDRPSVDDLLDLVDDRIEGEQAHSEQR